MNSIEIPGSDIVVRVGRYGPYLERGDQRAPIPVDLAPDELTSALAEELLAKPAEGRELGRHPQTGRAILLRTGRYGPYVTEELEEGSGEKPRTASLLQSMSTESVTLEDALRLLELPRVVGVDPADCEEVVAMNGRFGPFIRKGTETRSLGSDEQLFSITLEQALALLAQPKTRRARGGAKPPLR